MTGVSASWTYGAQTNPYLRPNQADKDSRLFVQQLDWTLGHKLPAYPLGSPFEQAQHYKSVAYAAITSTQRAVMGSTIGLERPRRVNRDRPDPGARKTDAKYVPLHGHPFGDVLKRPNPVTTWSQFQAQWILQKSLHGRCIIWGVKNKAGAPIRMYVIPTPLCTPAFGLGSEEYPVGAWRVQTYYPNTGLGGILPGPLAGSAGAVIDGREFYIDDAPHPLYPWTPYSPLVGMDTEFDIVEKMDRAVWSQLVNGVINPAGYIDLPGANAETIKAVQAKIGERFAGADRAGTPIAIGGGDPDRPAAKWTPTTPNSKDMGFGEMWDKYLDFVLSGSFGLDRSALGMSTGSYAERYAAKQDSRERTYEPMLAGMANTLTDGPAKDWGLTERGCRVNIVLPPLQDPTLIQGRNRDAAAASTMSVDEIRASQGQEPTEDGLGHLPPKLYEEALRKKMGLTPEPQNDGAVGRTGAATEGPAKPPSSPQAKGSLPNRMAPVMGKAMSAYQDSSGGTLVAAARQKRLLKAKRARQALGCLKKAIMADT